MFILPHKHCYHFGVAPSRFFPLCIGALKHYFVMRMFTVYSVSRSFAMKKEPQIHWQQNRLPTWNITLTPKPGNDIKTKLPTNISYNTDGKTLNKIPANQIQQYI